MDSRIEEYKPPTRTYYYDVDDRRILIGDREFKAHIKSKENAENIHMLGSLLLDQTIELPERENERFRKDDWPQERLIKYGRWLVRVLDQAEDSDRDEMPLTERPKKLNQTILRRARKLNLGPTSDYIKSPNGFGGLSPFYRAIDLAETHQVGLFDDWTRQDMVRYIKKLGDTLERRPRERDLLKKFRENRKNPSPAIMNYRFGNLRDLIEQAGYVIVKNWDEDDYCSWGVRYMLANDGGIPVQTTLDYFAKKELGPSYSTVASKFNGLLKYQAVIANLYQEKVEHRERHRQLQLSSIEKGLREDSLPHELFSELSDEAEMMHVYAKYLVVDSVAPEMSTPRKVATARGDYQDRNFVNSMRKYNSAITTGEVESEAVAIGVFDQIWPMDNFMTELRIPNDFRPYPRKRREVAHRSLAEA